MAFELRASWCAWALVLFSTSTAYGSKVSDAITAGDDGTLSNSLTLSIDVAKPFTLEASWLLLDADEGRFNTFIAGGDIRFNKQVDVDVQLDVAPRTNGVQSVGVTLTPTIEFDEGENFYTALIIPLLGEKFDIRYSDYADACMRAARPIFCKRYFRMH